MQDHTLDRQQNVSVEPVAMLQGPSAELGRYEFAIALSEEDQAELTASATEIGELKAEQHTAAKAAEMDVAV